MSNKITSLRGMSDLLPPETDTWQFMEDGLRAISHRFGFKEIRTPILENTNLFKRGVGEGTDIVEKEMYSFEDKGGESVTMRPEGTAPVVRSLVENSWFRAHPVSKLFYIGPMFRYERPQKGRFRQFHQFGIELLGVQEPSADVEVISFTDVVLKDFGLKSVELHINSVGCDGENCRSKYRSILIEKLLQVADQLPEDAQKRIQTNPQRLFDHKDESVKKVMATMPVLLDSLCEECIQHFEGVQAGLKNLNIPFQINPNIVRGLDYYNRTAFEFISSDLGAQSTVCGGGRYDKLIEQFGGPHMPAVGFGMGLERLALIIEAVGKRSEALGFDISIIYADKKSWSQALQMAYQLRVQGYRVDIDLQNKSMKNQFKKADKVGSTLALILGEQEAQSGTLTLKDLKSQEQKTIRQDQLESELKAYFK